MLQYHRGYSNAETTSVSDIVGPSYCLVAQGNHPGPNIRCSERGSSNGWVFWTDGSSSDGVALYRVAGAGSVPSRPGHVPPCGILLGADWPWEASHGCLPWFLLSLAISGQLAMRSSPALIESIAICVL